MHFLLSLSSYFPYTDDDDVDGYAIDKGSKLEAEMLRKIMNAENAFL